MLEATAVVGSLDECREKLEERRALGVDLPIADLRVTSGQDVGQVLERLLA